MRKFFILSPVTVVLIFVVHKNMNIFKDLVINSFLGDTYIMLFKNEKPVDAHHVMTTLDNGMKIIVNNKDGCVCKFIRIAGRWDSNETAAVDYLVHPGDKIVEVGANFGVYTLRMASLVGGNGHIEAFEANPNVSKYLDKSLKANGIDNVTLHNLAAGDNAGDSNLVFSTANIGGGHLTHFKSKNTVAVRVVKLDETVKLEKVDVLKIDAEGCEEKIIDGANKIIKSNENIILMIEWSISQLKCQGSDPIRFASKLREYGFNAWRIGKREGKKPTFIPTTYAEVLSTEYCDLVLSRKSVL